MKKELKKPYTPLKYIKVDLGLFCFCEVLPEQYSTVLSRTELSAQPYSSQHRNKE